MPRQSLMDPLFGADTESEGLMQFPGVFEAHTCYLESDWPVISYG